jgi:hypothetical protein
MSDWSDDEIVRLVESIEQQALSAGEAAVAEGSDFIDWSAVALHVGTGRLPHDCLRKFAALDLEGQRRQGELDDDDDGHKFTIQEYPFSFAENPVLAQVRKNREKTIFFQTAFLATCISPLVGAAAAKAAVLEMMSKKQSEISDGDDTDMVNTPVASSPSSSDLDDDITTFPFDPSSQAATAIKTLKKAVTTALVVADNDSAEIQSRLLPRLLEQQAKKVEAKLAFLSGLVETLPQSALLSLNSIDFGLRREIQNFF